MLSGHFSKEGRGVDLAISGCSSSRSLCIFRCRLLLSFLRRGLVLLWFLLCLGLWRRRFRRLLFFLRPSALFQLLFAVVCRQACFFGAFVLCAEFFPELVVDLLLACLLENELPADLHEALCPAVAAHLDGTASWCQVLLVWNTRAAQGILPIDQLYAVALESTAASFVEVIGILPILQPSVLGLNLSQAAVEVKHHSRASIASISVGHRVAILVLLSHRGCFDLH
mmetsp:Transcript_60399/g.128006  ORF Transcript_60399/g.128006 Transcript_60399/m.128006 type:complete len:226 (-) Transcript_60399:309-986(-)